MNAGAPQSLLAMTLAGAAPSVSGNGLPPTAVHRHALDAAAKPGARATNLRSVAASAPAGANGTSSREFTAADKALIRKVHGYMSPLQLLGILNERLTADLGGNVTLYTIEQLRAEIAAVSSAVPASGNDWASLRKVLAKARRDGVLALISEEVINDFAVVYSLTQKQVLTLKDILLKQNEEEDE